MSVAPWPAPPSRSPARPRLAPGRLPPRMLVSTYVTSSTYFLLPRYCTTKEGRGRFPNRDLSPSCYTPIAMPHYAVGIDMIAIPRVRAAIERHDDRFLRRVYTPEEVAVCRGRVQDL